MLHDARHDLPGTASTLSSTARETLAYGMRLASRPADWDLVRGLRKRGSASSGLQPPHGDAYDTGLNTLAFLLSRGPRAIGTTRTSVSSERRQWPLPALLAFRAEIESAIGLDSTIIEASQTVVDPAVRGDSKNAFFHLFKAHMLHCALEDADWLVSAVSEGEIGFYRRMFNMEILSGAEAYPGLDGARVLMGLDFRKNAALLAKRIPTIAVTPADEAEFVASGRVEFSYSSR